ncbi:hypothetical protein B5807_01401 [Epicoccum nigrum]|uniref:Uncharacterized protein n=1 Tax=Epicoccum nigrum TaxID=105696 RepID=A0A1Y2MFB6_EPING|nr:hypothetical protein B5807_01401 [Epicoccum nigrum]
MTTASFVHIDPSSYTEKPWSKVDGPGQNFERKTHVRDVHNLRGREHEFTTDNSGFAVYNYPAKEKLFTDDRAVRIGYYKEVEDLLRNKIPGIKKVHIFDHTIRRRVKDSARQPVQQVHVDQTPAAAEARVRRHIPQEEADELVRGRYQIINVWRPIENPASDHPLAVIDWRTTSPSDFIATDLLYPRRDSQDADDDDRGKEKLPDPSKYNSTEGYEVKGETMGVAPNDSHRFYYQKDMTPEEVLLLKTTFTAKTTSVIRTTISARTTFTAGTGPHNGNDSFPRSTPNEFTCSGWQSASTGYASSATRHASPITSHATLSSNPSAAASDATSSTWFTINTAFTTSVATSNPLLCISDIVATNDSSHHTTLELHNINTALTDHVLKQAFPTACFFLHYDYALRAPTVEVSITSAVIPKSINAPKSIPSSTAAVTAATSIASAMSNGGGLNPMARTLLIVFVILGVLSLVVAIIIFVMINSRRKRSRTETQASNGPDTPTAQDDTIGVTTHITAEPSDNPFLTASEKAIVSRLSVPNTMENPNAHTRFSDAVSSFIEKSRRMTYKISP